MINVVQQIYELLGLGVQANIGDLYGLSSMMLVLIAGFLQFFNKGGTARKSIENKSESVKEQVQQKELQNDFEDGHKTQEETKDLEQEQATEIEIGRSWSERLSKGLERSRSQVWSRLGTIFSGGGLSEEQLEEVEELLYGADIGPKTASELTEALSEKAQQGDFNEEAFKDFLFNFLKERLEPIQSKLDNSLYEFQKEEQYKGPKVIMIVGVNGAGKTTTIGKLATKLKSQGAKVVVGACDTFRAAAVDQLQVWCDRSGATMIRAKEGANPSGVGYDAVQEAINQKADYCLLDTAGRLHTKENLMEELSKSKNVLKKLDETAPHHVLLVIDAITGQNAIRQAEQFNKALDLTGLIFTKCDGSSKAGSAVSIVQSLSVPITYIGVGESVEDLNNFNLDEYLNALLKA